MRKLSWSEWIKLKADLIKRCSTMHRRFKDVLDLYSGDYHVINKAARDAGKVHEVIPVTARILVDNVTAHVKPQEAKIKFEPVRPTEKARELADMEEAAAHEIVERHSSVKANSPINEATKNAAIYGLGVTRQMFNVRAWGERPKRNNGESKEDFEWREGLWEAERRIKLPFRIDTPDPLNILSSSFDDTPDFMIETYQVQPFYLKEQFPDFDDPNPFALKQFTACWSISQWIYMIANSQVEDKIRLDKGDNLQQLDSYFSTAVNQPRFLRTVTLPNGEKVPTDYNPYGIIPYCLILSGLGKHSPQGKPEEQAVGLLYPLKSLLKEEARSLTAISMILQVTAMPRFLSRYAPKGKLNIGMAPGDVTEIGGAVIEPFPGLTVPPDLYNIVQILDQQIEMMLGAKLLTGIRPAGVTSALFEEILLEQAERRYQTFIESIEAATARIIAQEFFIWEHIVREKIPGIKLDPLKIKSAYNCHVKFSYEDIAKQRIKTMIAKMMFQAGLFDFVKAHEYIGTEDISSVRKGLIKDKIYSDPYIISALGMKVLKELDVDVGELYKRAMQRGYEGRKIELPSTEEEGVLQQLLGKGVEQSVTQPGFGGGGYGANMEGGMGELESLGV